MIKRIINTNGNGYCKIYLDELSDINLSYDTYFEIIDKINKYHNKLNEQIQKEYYLRLILLIPIIIFWLFCNFLIINDFLISFVCNTIFFTFISNYLSYFNYNYDFDQNKYQKYFNKLSSYLSIINNEYDLVRKYNLEFGLEYSYKYLEPQLYLQYSKNQNKINIVDDYKN
jgi:hypothetical protein